MAVAESLSSSKWQLIMPKAYYLEQGQACFYSNNNQKHRYLFPKADKASLPFTHSIQTWAIILQKKNMTKLIQCRSA